MQNILITGANRGIGLALTANFLEHGDFVIATCRHPSKANSLHKLREQYGEAMLILPMDVRDIQQINECKIEAAKHIDVLHLLINNAGVLRYTHRLDQIDMDNLMESFQVNAAGPTMVTKIFAELLYAGRPSKVVNITMPTPPISKWTRAENQIYVASRYASNSLTKMIALEIHPMGVTTVGLYPGYIQTDMNEHSPDALPVSEGIHKVIDTIANITPDQNGLALLPDGSVYDW